MNALHLLEFLLVLHYSNSLDCGGIIPVAYSPDLGVNSTTFDSPCLVGIEIYPGSYQWPWNYSGAVYHTAVGKFQEYFGLSTVADSVAYFITENPPPRHINSSNWLRMVSYLPDLSPIVERFSKRSPEIDDRVFISDDSLDCRQLRELTSMSFNWSVLANNTEKLKDNLLQLKLEVGELTVHFAICNGQEFDFTKSVLDGLLETGLFFGSEIYIYTMKEVSDAINNYGHAGASLTVVSPALSNDPVDVAFRTLDQFSALYICGSVICHTSIQFNSPNFLELVLNKTVSVHEDYTICFTNEGYRCIVYVNITDIHSNGSNAVYNGSYDLRNGELTLGSDIHQRSVVTLLAFQDTTFLPSFNNAQFSMAIQMIKEIFATKFTYNFEVVEVPYNANVTIQELVEEILSRPSYSNNRMSAFPLPFDTGTTVRHTEAVLYDGIVMIKSRGRSDTALFRIFDSLSGYIWLCIFASLIFVAIIFFIIKVVYHYQIRAMGFEPDDQDVSLLKRFLNVIFQNFSALLLAKMIVKPKQTSIRVLYQTYWMTSILFVATYTASLAEQRFVPHESVVPFNSLRGLLENEAHYRWIFIRNSSVIWKMQQSEDEVLKKLMQKADKEWPQDAYANSLEEAAIRVESNDHLILISSRLEAVQILGEKCDLAKVAPLGGKSGPVEYLYALGYFLSGADDFVKTMTVEIDALSTKQVFNNIEMRSLGVGGCPLPSEQINMQQKPFSLKELGGLFIIVLVGIIIAFAIAGIEYAIEKYPMYRQWKRENIRFGEAYTSEVLNVQEGGIWIRLLEKNTTAFVDSGRIKTPKGRRAERMRSGRLARIPRSDGRPNFELGSYVKATYMGNDPHTADPVFTVTEEKVFKPENDRAIPPNNQAAQQ